MLTKREQETLHYIQTYMSQYGRSPTVQEIAHGLGITSRGVAYRYLKGLETGGYVRIVKGRRRNIELLNEGLYQQSLPLVGRIAAGQPIEAIENPEVIRLEHLLCGNDHFALKVKGESMIEEGILEGDIVICKQAATAQNGDIVVALIDSTEATLKRYEQTGDTVILHPAHAEMTPLRYPAAQVQIQGVFVGLLRLNQTL